MMNSRKGSDLISVIITNYNYGKYISEAIYSILNQSYENVELIIINDGSTDDSDKIINKIIKKNPKRNIVYINRENRGVVYTRNEGLEAAKGEYICYLDADDYFNTDYLEKSYEIAKDYDADVVYPNWHFVGDWLGRPDTKFPEFSLEGLQLQKLHCTPASLVRKESVGSHRFEVEKVAEDWDFFLGLSFQGLKFKLADDNFINYRIRQGTRSSANDPREDTVYFMEILQKYKDTYGDKVVDPRRLEKLRHPSMVRKVLNLGYFRAISESIESRGLVGTVSKIKEKIIQRMPWAWQMRRSIENYVYYKNATIGDMKSSNKTKLAVVVHLYYPDLWPVIQSKLEQISEPFDLFVSVQAKDRNISLERAGTNHKKTNIVVLPNRGRDVLPFLVILKEIKKAKQYEYILKIHSKKSPHRKDGNSWFNDLLGQLIPRSTSGIIRVLNDKDTGIVGPEDHVVSLSRYMGDNRNKLRTVLLQISNDNEDLVGEIFQNLDKYPFFGGTMFWCRLDFIDSILKSGITPSDFNAEKGQVDSTTAHALERATGKALHLILDKKMYTVGKKGVKELPEIRYGAKYKHGPSDG